MKLLVTADAILVFLLKQHSGPGMALDFTPTIMVSPRDYSPEQVWEEYSLDVLPMGGRYGFSFVENDGTVYLYSSAGLMFGFAFSTARMPLAASGWTLASGPPVPAAAHYNGRLTFMENLPCIILSRQEHFEFLPPPRNYHYNLSVALASSTQPLTAAEWATAKIRNSLLTIRDYPDIYAYVAGQAAEGGLAVAQMGMQNILEIYYAPDVSSLLSDEDWPRLELQSPDGNPVQGAPVALLATPERMFLGYQPLDAAGFPEPQFMVAMSAEPTGVAAPWTFAGGPGFGAVRSYYSRIRTTTPLVLWGDRLLAFEDDPEGVTLRRMLFPGISGDPVDWQAQRLVTFPEGIDVTGQPVGQPSRPHATIAVHGLDCYILYSNPEDPAHDTGLWLAVAQGSW